MADCRTGRRAEGKLESVHTAPDEPAHTRGLTLARQGGVARGARRRPRLPGGDVPADVHNGHTSTFPLEGAPEPGSGPRRRVFPHTAGLGAVRPSGRGGLQLAVLAAAAGALVTALVMRHSGLDLDVYRAGARALGKGHLLYSDAFDAGRRPHLLFTYPPVGALLAWPAAQIPHLPAILCWNVATLTVLGWLIRLTAPALFAPARPGQRLGSRTRLVVAVALIAWTTPIIDHLGFGQVNVFLLALCAADCLLPRTRWPRGLLVGAAAAVKLVPGIFIVYLLLTRRRRPALAAAASFVAITALVWLAFPVASQDFWLHALGRSSRIGDVGYFSNQSISGMLARAGHAPGCLHLGLVAAAGAAGLWAARRSHAWGRPQAGFLLAGMTMNLVSPISWMHHFVALCLALVLLWQEGLASTGRRRARLLGATVTAYVLLAARLPYLGDFLVRAGGAHALAVAARESYLLLTVAVMAVLFAAVAPHRPAPAAAAGRQSARERAREAGVC